MKLSVKAKLYPTSSQKKELAKVFGASRFIYNWGLQRKTEQYTLTGKSDSYNQLAKALTVLKKEQATEWLGETPVVCLQQSLQHLENAFTKFFRKQAKYPRFKSRYDSQQSARYVGGGFKVRGNRLVLAKMDTGIKLRWSRGLHSVPSSCVVTKRADDTYWVSFVCEAPHVVQPAPFKGIGLDLGLTDFVVTSRGDKHKLPKQEKAKRRVRTLQRSLSRKKKGSNNRRKAAVLVARACRRVVDARKDFLHKLSKQIVVENQDIAMENLAVKNMARNRCLSRAISESGWREFRSMIEYKGRLHGRNVMIIDRFFPSTKTCHGCGHVVEKLPLDVRLWECPACGAEHDRDVNAAINILAAGYAVSACGVDGRPVKGYARNGRSAVKQESNVN